VGHTEDQHDGSRTIVGFYSSITITEGKPSVCTDLPCALEPGNSWKNCAGVWGSAG
jgi:hypothetical protein